MDLVNILDRISERRTRKMNDEILLLDSTNTLIRNFSFIKALNTEGTHVGGTTGFLKSLGSLTRTLDPTRVICVFDGKGGSLNRKSMNPEYKAQRKHQRITNWGMYDSRDEEQESLHSQVGRVRDYLDTLPVTVLEMEKLEADDILAYIAKQASLSGKKVTIVSTDQDFLQLVDENIRVYSPIKKIMYGQKQVKEDLGILPENYIIMKSLLGDDSDNLPGIKGLGPKTLLKEFPELGGISNLTLDFIYERCEERMKGKIIYPKILEGWDRVESNFKLMNLHQTMLSEEECREVSRIMHQKVKPVNVQKFQTLLKEDKIENFVQNIHSWIQSFQYLYEISLQK